MKDAHTPLPWQIHSDYDPLVIIGNIDGPDEGRMHYHTVCECLDRDNGEVNAALIVRAVNSHEALVKALKDMLGVFEEYAEDWPKNSVGAQIVREAKIALANGGQP